MVIGANSFSNKGELKPRSPRSLSKFCYGIEYGYYPTELIATVLSLAHFSGWSADRIRLQILETFGISVEVGYLWTLHKNWMRARPHLLSKDELLTANFLLSKYGFDTMRSPLPLSMTAQPVRSTCFVQNMTNSSWKVCVKFRKEWTLDVRTSLSIML